MSDLTLRRLLNVLVATIAAIAFVVSFDAIQSYAARVGAFPRWLAPAAPLLVDTFTLAATVTILLRSRAGVRAGYAWVLLAAGSGASIAINVAHAPHTAPAMIMAALPPVALLASLELVMSEARRARARESADPAAGPRASRAMVRELLAADPDADTARVMAVTGLGARRAQELLRAERNGHRSMADR